MGWDMETEWKMEQSCHKNKKRQDASPSSAYSMWKGKLPGIERADFETFQALQLISESGLHMGRNESCYCRNFELVRSGFYSNILLDAYCNSMRSCEEWKDREIQLYSPLLRTTEG